MLRCYDKATLMKVAGPWTRIELELREGFGNRVATAMLSDGIWAVGNQAIRDFIQCDLDWFNEALYGPSVEIPAPPQKISRKRQWYRGAIRSGLTKLIYADALDGNFEVAQDFWNTLREFEAMYPESGWIADN